MRIHYDNSSTLANKVKTALENNDSTFALSILEDEQNYVAFRKGSGELIPVISKYISWEYESENINLFNGCIKLFEKVIESTRAEDLLESLLEAIESSVDTTQFTTILSYTPRVLQKVSRDHANFLSWTVNSLENRLNKCRIPDYNESSVRSDNEVFHIEIIYQDILAFYEKIIPYFSQWFQEQEVYRLIFIKYLIQLLAKPIGYLDLGPHSEARKIRKIAENIVRKVLALCEDPFEYLEMNDNDYVNPHIFAYGIFLHLLFDENINQVVPRIYDNAYLFHSSLIYITKLLNSVCNVVILKGLFTLELLLKRTAKLSHFILDIEANKGLCQAMETIIIYNNHEEIRKKALDIFTLYLHKFEAKAQYILLTNLMFKIGHMCLSGYVITQYKDILFGLQQKNKLEVSTFQGDRLYSFIKNCYKTIDTDGNLQYDKIICLLNLMRFTVLQEKVKNWNQFINITCIWKTQFFDRLESSLGKIRDEYKEMISNVENDKPHPALNFDGNDVDCLSKPDKLRSLKISLTQIEMTDSILKRLIELIDEGKH